MDKCLVSSPIMGLLTGIGHPPQRGGIYALLAQSAEHQTLNLRVAGSSPARGYKVYLVAKLDKLFR